MPRQIVNQVESNFSGGLITEATALNFPENACTAADNVIFSPKGGVSRRPGLDYENGYTTRSVTLAGNAMSYTTWKNPAGADETYFVIQIGRYLYFYEVKDAAMSASAHSTVIDMDSYKTSTATLLAQNECQFAFGQGYLFVVHPYCEPFYVQYTEATDALTSSTITVYTRDTDGIIDELIYDYDTRPTSLTNAHKYNLYNQGWSPNPTDYITAWRTNVTHTEAVYAGNGIWVSNTVTDSVGNSNYPSNADVWWMCLNSDNVFWPSLATSNKRGNTPAPKGYYVLNAWNMDRATASGITGIASTTSGVNRPSAIAFFAGRVFYAGCNADGYANKIFFTQVIKSTEQFGRCHQLNDPTNKDLFDLLATDGGFVSIPEAGRILKLVSIQTSLIVFATNGVWVITGNQNIGFSAGDYAVRKISSIPAVSASSFVDVEGLPCWWNYDGIYIVSQVGDTNYSGGVKIDSLTQMSIRTFFKEEIPVASKLYARGSYNQLNKEISWTYRSSAITNFEDNYAFDRVLTYSTINQSFYPWSFGGNVKIHGVTSQRTRGTFRQTVSGTRTDVTSMQGSVSKFVVSSSGNLSFAETKNSGYLDFGTTDYTSYLVTGYNFDQAARKLQANYVTIFSRFQDVPQFYFQGIFDSGNTANSGRWGTNQLVTFPEIGDYDYYKKKLKVRGTGNVLQFKVSSVTGKPFDIAGWFKWQTANAGI